MEGVCRGCRLDRTWFHLCFCSAVICSESLWQIQDGTGIVLVHDPQHAAFFLGNIRDGYGDLFRDSEENSVSVNRCSFGNYFFKDAFVDFWVFDVVEGYAEYMFGVFWISAGPQYDEYGDVLCFAEVFVSADLFRVDHWLLWMFFQDRISDRYLPLLRTSLWCICVF